MSTTINTGVQIDPEIKPSTYFTYIYLFILLIIYLRTFIIRAKVFIYLILNFLINLLTCPYVTAVVKIGAILPNLGENEGKWWE